MDLNAPNSLNSTSESQHSSIQQIQQENCEKMNINDKMTRNAAINEEILQLSKNQENLKRKKSKPRNSTIPLINNSYYPKELDTWLENCIKDISAPQLSSSSEFLDYNTSSFTSNKNMTIQPQLGSNKPLSQTFKLNSGFQKNDMTNPMNSFNLNKVLRNLDHNNSPGEFASLPPLNNFEPNADSSCIENFDPNDPSRSFRFSDPCLIGVSDNESIKISEQNNSENKNTSDTNKFLTTLLEQINILHETNSKICRNLHETKVEIEALKHTSWGGLRHRRDSLSGLSTHSQPMGFGFGNQSPAPTYHSGIYTPGMMTDVVREVKEAARVREEALINRVKAMVEERSWSIGEGNLRLMRDIEEMKAQIQHLKSDKRETNKRITQLEAENKYVKSILISMLNNKTVEIINENESMRSNPARKNYIESLSSRQKRSDGIINHGSINQAGGGEIFQHALIMNEKNKIQKSTLFDVDKLNQSQNGSATRTVELFATPENERNTTNVLSNDGGSHNIQTMELRRELQEALASKKQAESRVIALENMVKHLQVKVTNSEDCNSDGGGIGDGIYNGSNTSTIGGISNDNISQTNLLNLSQYPSQIQILSSKLSLAGPITDL